MAGSEPHFLHRKKSIQAVLQPPIDGARALTWLGSKELLLVATADGQLIEVDPVYGTRKLSGSVSDPACLSSSPDGKVVLVVERGQGIAIHETRRGERQAAFEIPLLSDLAVNWLPRPGGRLGFVVTGQTLDGRVALISEPTLTRRKRVRLPKQTVIGMNGAGQIVAARVCTDGLRCVPFGQPLPKGQVSAHRLRFAGPDLVLGLAEGGLTVWSGNESRTIMSFEITAGAVHHKGEVVALGTRSGSVAFAALADGSVKRARPGKVSGHDGAVQQLCFSKTGSWIASSANGVRLWRW